MTSRSDRSVTKTALPPRGKSRHCRYCQRYFQKDEHVIRHERTHTGDRPFPCQICQRRFARFDTLTRHQKTHKSDRSQNPHEVFGLANDQSELAPSVSTSLDAQAASWQQYQSQTPAMAYMPADPPLQDNINSAPMPYLDPDLTNSVPFDGTEDMLAYLFPSPLAWSTPITASNANQDVDLVRADSANNHTDPLLTGMEQTSPPALLHLDALIHDTSANYKRGIKQRGITCSFFDICLSLFFSRFNPTFPIIHEPTYTMKSTSPFVLLNMVAIGSLFIGSQDALSKGEYLWEVAFVAAGTRWNYVYEQSPDDPASNMQIVTCVALGQVYAMLSKSSKLRHHAQISQGWVFSWALKLGMFDLKQVTREDLPTLDTPFSEKVQRWKIFATLEAGRRALLGNFIIDAHLARFSGGLPMGNHVLNSLPWTAHDAIFKAATVDVWIVEMNRHGDMTPSFQELYSSLFDPANFQQMPNESAFSISVLMEGVQATISQSHAASENAVNIPSRHKIFQVLRRIRSAYLQHFDVGSGLFELHIRWHALCLELLADPVKLFRQLLGQSQKQQIFCVGQPPPPSSDVPMNWVQSMDGQYALLHATAIHDLAENLPLGSVYAFYSPMAVFAASTVYCAFHNAGHVDFSIRHGVEWTEIEDPESIRSVAQLSFHSHQPQPDRRKINLRHSLYQSQTVLRAMSSPWGLAEEMQGLLCFWMSSGSE